MFYTALIAMYGNLTEFTDALVTTNETFDEISRLHAVVVRRGAVRVVGIVVVALALLLSMLAVVVLFDLVPGWHHAVGWAALVLVLALFGVWYAVLWTRNRHLSALGRTWTAFA